MSIPRFQVPKFGAGVLAGGLDKMVLALEKTLGALVNAVTNDAIIPAALDTVAVRVFHGLGESPTAWEVVGRDAAAVVYEDPSILNDARDRYLWLAASAPVNVRVRFT